MITQTETAADTGARGPSHHVGEAELLEHVVGADDDALSLAVACHLCCCATCRAEARRLRAVGGALLDAEAPAPVDNQLLERVLARLDGNPQRVPKPSRDGLGRASSPSPTRLDEPAPPAEAAPPATAIDTSRLSVELTRLGLPAPLMRRLAAARRARWRYVAPGVRGIDLPVRSAAAATAQLLCLRQGLTIPRHDHSAPEVTLVLTGALLDGGERFGPGDVLFREPGQRHLQEVEPHEACIALVVNAGKLVPLTLKGRLLKLIARP